MTAAEIQEGLVHPIVETKRAELAALCRGYGVERLELFGSAAREDFDSTRSDLDFLVTLGIERDRQLVYSA